ncbi:hypothetical protein [Lysobacter auxotrophicus]|uniref:Uncharacterized protein n=1 Tax=Lysobacter auxotrophicus TaxID=2992573 RepID=A0ABM8DER0_9GAMM|nr:hypothetical protein [Lysobacter auxotrophicus]BDU17062.1 hypothetical protein LA521A_22630 [Lysobacter auxotrophicus]
MLLIVTAVILLAGPALLALAGVFAADKDANVAARTRWSWRTVVVSTLLYTLAFNLTFFVQEVFLVVPKALTPGLAPTLFHNNHSWTGENPLASLFQGTGALATALVGLACLVALRAGRPRAGAWRLFVVWMAYCGLLMALPQVVIGALSTGSDVGMAMEYFGLSPQTKTVMAWIALVAIAVVSLALLRPVLELADEPADVATRCARTRFVLQTVALPMLLGTALVIPFRIPREALEVVLLPLIVGVPGALWMLAGAWRVRDVRANGVAMRAFVTPLLAAIVLLLVFQLVLRPGVAFY